MTEKPLSVERRSFCGGLGAVTVSPLVVPPGAMAQPYPQPKPSFLEVPGAHLYYEVHGSGALMLLIPGANGTADAFIAVTKYLAQHFTVVTYDRRGFSRSQLDGPQDYYRRLETEADDVRRLIKHMGDRPATIFGSSSGAIIALEVLTRHSSIVGTLVPHEPPAVRLLADGQKWIDFFHEVYDVYRRSGMAPAIDKFREQAFAESDRQAMARVPKNEHALANASYWFEHELRQYPAVELNLETLKGQAGRILLTAGRESRGHPTYEVSAELGRRLARNLIELPGGHVGFLSQPAEFARALLDALAVTGGDPKL